MTQKCEQRSIVAITNAPYLDIQDMHEALDAMYKQGYEWASDHFDADTFKVILGNAPSKSRPITGRPDPEMDEIEILLAIGRREFLHKISSRLDFSENNPLGSAEEEFSLGYADRAEELIKLREDGYCMKDRNGASFCDRWEIRADVFLNVDEVV